jgi:hypothetical protein
MNYKIINDRTININNVLISFPCSISRDIYKNPFIFCKDGLVIINFYPRTDEEAKEISNNKNNIQRNIWAYDLNGVKVWEIAESPASSYKTNPYISIYEENGKIIAGSIGGFDHVVDISTGSVELIKGGRPW